MRNNDITVSVGINEKDIKSSILNSLSDLPEDIEKKLNEAFAKAGNNKKLKSQFTGIYQKLIDESREAAGNVDLVSSAVDNFSKRIEYLQKIESKTKIKGVLNNLSVGDIDKLLGKLDEYVNKEKQIEKLSSQEFKDNIKTKNSIKSLSALRDEYVLTEKEQKKYIDGINKTFDKAGVDKSSFTKQIKEYSILLSLFEKSTNKNVAPGSLDEVKKYEELYFIMQKITKLEGGAKFLTSFRESLKAEIPRINDSLESIEFSNGLNASIEQYSKSLIKPLKSEIASLLSDAAKEAKKMSMHQGKSDAKIQGKLIDDSQNNSNATLIKNLKEVDEELSNIEKHDGSNISMMDKALDNLKEGYQDVIKYAVDAETALNRINEIWDKYANGKGKLFEGETEEMFNLMRRFDSLDQESQTNGLSLSKEQKELFESILFEEDYAKTFDRIDELTQKQISNLKSIKQISGDIIPDNSIDNDQFNKLQNEINEVKEDITSIKGRIDTLEDTSAFDKLSSQVNDFDERIKNTDGSIENLLNSFKLLSELSLTDLQKVAIPFFNGINQVYQDKNGKQISGYWDDLKSEIENSNTALKELLSNIGLLNKSTNSVKLIDSGLNNSGGIIGDNATIIARKNDTLSGQSQYDKSSTLKAKLDEAYEAGVNVARILDIIGTKESKVILEVQETQAGGMLGNDNLEDITKSYVNKEYLEATDEQILKLIQDIQTLEKIGLSVDLNSNNLFYDKDKGFSIIDLSTDGQFFKSYEDMIEELGYAMQGTTRQIFEDLNNIEDEPLVKAFEERFTKLSKQAQDAYANAQDSNSPSKEFEKLENDAVDGIVIGANENEEKLKNVGRQMAENVKAGFKEGISEIGSEASSDKSNISSENGSVIEQQIKEQNDLQDEIRETIALTNEYGEVIDVYRGTRGLIGNGNVSNRYHGGTFWTSNRNLATQSYADGNKVTHANLYMQNPYLVHGGGAEWDQLVLSIKQGEELEKHLETVYTSINDIFTKIQNTSGIEAGHLFDVFNGQLNFTDFENGIQKPIESLKDFQSIFESIDYDGSKIPQVQNYINQLYDLFTSYSRISELSEKGILNTNEITEIAKALKYDGVVFKGIFDGIDEPSDVFVTFEEKQSKVIDMITAAQLRAEEEQSIASMLVDTRKNFYETLKSLSSEQIDSFVDKSAFNFVTDGSYIESLGEVLRNADPTESIDNIKNKIKEYINDVVNEFENAQKQISSIETPIKDVFQGDDNSNTSFSSNLDEIEKEKSALLELRNAVSLITEEIDRKTQAFHNEKSAVDLIIPEEIATLESLERELKIIIESIEQISKIPINIDFNLENLDENSTNAISKLKDSLSGFNGSSLTNISSILEGFKISKANVENLQKLANAILTLKSNLNNVGNSGQQFLSDIKELVAQSDGLKDLATVLKSTQKQIDNAKKTTNTNVDSKNTKENANTWKELTYSIQRYSEVSKRISSGKALEGDIEEASRLENKISQLQKLDILSPTQIEKSEQMLTKLYDTLDDIEKKSKEATLESLNSSIDKYRNDYNSRSSKPFTDNQSDQYKKLLANYETSIAKLEAYRDKISNNPLVSKEDLNQIDELTKKVKDSATAFNSLTSSQKGSTPLSRGKTIEWANDLLEQNSKWSKKAKIEVQGWINKLATADPSNVEEIRNRILEIVRAEREAGNAGKTWLDIFSTKKLHHFLGQAASMFSFYDLINVGREAFQTIRELDTALVEMKKVSDETTQSLKNYQSTTFDVGDAVGATAKTIQNSTADWMRLGESIDEAAESAKVSNILLNVSEFESIDEATESLISMSQAYKELEKSEIVDVANKLGNEFAISTDGIATALKDSASALKTAQNDFYEASALAVAANTVVQDPSKVGAGKFMPEYIVICRYFIYQKVAISVKNQGWSRPREGYNIC